MDSLSVASSLHKAQIAATKPWHILLTIQPDPVNTPEVALRLARSPEDVEYRGKTYLAFSFDFDVIWDKGTGELQSVKLKVSNIQRAVQIYLQQYKGGQNMQVQVDVVSAEDLQSAPAQTFIFYVTESEADAVWATLTVGGSSPTMQAMMRYLYFATFCPNVYNSPTLQAACDPRGVLCGYWGPLATCVHTLEDCKAHGNEVNFGGYPAIATQGFLAVSST